MTTPDDGLVEATKADCAAARAAQVDMLIGGAQGDKDVWRKVEKAFARHRIASTAALEQEVAALREALEERLGSPAAAKVSGGDGKTYAVYPPSNASIATARAIRVRTAP